MPLTKNHGGQCCGIQHIHFLGDSPRQDKLDYIREKIDFISNGRGNSRGGNPTSILLEVTITGAQARRGWKRELKKLGFVPVTKFKNRNSGHIIYVMHYCNRLS